MGVAAQKAADATQQFKKKPSQALAGQKGQKTREAEGRKEVRSSPASGIPYCWLGSFLGGRRQTSSKMPLDLLAFPLNCNKSVIVFVWSVSETGLLSMRQVPK